MDLLRAHRSGPGTAAGGAVVEVVVERSEVVSAGRGDQSKYVIGEQGHQNTHDRQGPCLLSDGRRLNGIGGVWRKDDDPKTISLRLGHRFERLPASGADHRTILSGCQRVCACTDVAADYGNTGDTRSAGRCPVRRGCALCLSGRAPGTHAARAARWRGPVSVELSLGRRLAGRHRSHRRARWHICIAERTSATWAVGGLLIGAAVPFTLIAILPTNRRLLGKERINALEHRALMKRWARLHAVRSLLGLVGLLVLIYAALHRG
jgi:hypothetical protein